MSQGSSVFRSPAYGWVIVVLAALAMVATLPGRTHGLGMITERLLDDTTLELDRKTFGYINLWATLIGALFCIPTGWMLDRCGLRMTLSVVAGLLGLVVIAMTGAIGAAQFAVLIMLTRGLGQSALSVVSISMTGKWFRSRLALATGVYSFLVSLGFIGAGVWGSFQIESKWRVQWFVLGAVLLFVLTPLFALLVRSAPDQSVEDVPGETGDDETDFTLSEALATPAFWMFGIAMSLYLLISSGTSLFNQSLLTGQGFGKTAFYHLFILTTAVGLGSNLLTGWLATRIPLTRLAAASMILLAGSLLGLPFVHTYPALIAYGVAIGCAGGMVTVIFFTVWARLFGRAHLGRIQGVAQMLTVFASGLGPVIMAEVESRYHSYLPAIVCLGLLASAMAVAMIFVPVPRREPAVGNIAVVGAATSS